MHITGGGILILAIIGAIILAIILFKRWRSGGSMSLKGISMDFKRQKNDKNTVLCFNVYSDKIVGEYMLRKSVLKDADEWKLGSKTYLYQGYDGKNWLRIVQPDKVSYQPERLARMMGCEPLRRLKSLKFKWYEHLAPFAPVAALGIAALLLIMVT